MTGRARSRSIARATTWSTPSIVHGGALHTLPAWAEWAGLLRELTARASLAFRGDANLHESEAAIARLGEVYGRLREQYAAR